MTTVVNLRREPYDVYIGRAGKGHSGYFGNPMRIEVGNPKARANAIERYRRYFDERMRTDPTFRERVHGLAGKRLGCFCSPYACHGHVIAEYLNAREQRSVPAESSP